VFYSVVTNKVAQILKSLKGAVHVFFIFFYMGIFQGSVFRYFVCELIREQLRRVHELFANRCSRVLREQNCCLRHPLVRELIREQFANQPMKSGT